MAKFLQSPFPRSHAELEGEMWLESNPRETAKLFESCGEAGRHGQQADAEATWTPTGSHCTDFVRNL